MKHLREWQERWISKFQHGARAGHAVEDVYWSLALQIEKAMLEGISVMEKAIKESEVSAEDMG